MEACRGSRDQRPCVSESASATGPEALLDRLGEPDGGVEQFCDLARGEVDDELRAADDAVMPWLAVPDAPPDAHPPGSQQDILGAQVVEQRQHLVEQIQSKRSRAF